MTELHDEQAAPRQEYVQRVTALLREAADWCRDRGLQTELLPYTVREERAGEYEAPALYISKDGVSLAKLVPAGSRIIAAYGRVDLAGPMASHAFLFYVGRGPEFKSATIANGQTVHSSSARILHGVDGDGWYWIESKVRRAKRVDESLFIDLLTDVSDYEL
ncbi:hypothetical protein [Cupriavidus basilensis]|uniref:hypothetical protein n=1 Tax=Cupriavidus basilensis TaxID=68895 RepID=UPI0020A67F1C|nr:hypothetical protein [Cupriavidus basilensis]MCP3020391.1 hypothetical protein [Cupriavidus basilensis]